MYRILSAFVLSGLLSLVTAVAPGPAAAGDGYYNGSYRGYYRNYDDRSYTSSSCCDRGIALYERGYRVGYERPYYRSYSDRNYYEGSSYVTARYYESPRRYYGYDYSDQPRRFYPVGCYFQRVRVYDNLGGWVWSTSAVCN